MPKTKSKYNYKSEEENLGSDERSAFVKKDEEEEEELTVREEGQEIVPTEGEEGGEEEGGGKKEEEEEAKYTFKTEEELNTFIKARVKSTTIEPKKEEPKEEEEQEDPLDSLVFYKGSTDKKGKWVGESPADWNDFARKIIRHLSSDDQKQKVVDYLKNLNTGQKKEMEDLNKEFDAEYDAMATEGLIPKRNTKEGAVVNAGISAIGSKYGMTSMRKAHELWVKLPKTSGGGLDYKPTTKKVNLSKQASRLIGSSKKSQGAKKGKNKMSYNELHSARGVDEILDKE